MDGSRRCGRRVSLATKAESSAAAGLPVPLIPILAERRGKKWSSHGDCDQRFEPTSRTNAYRFPKGCSAEPHPLRPHQTGEENYFFWLCVDEPNLAFVVTDPSIFFKIMRSDQG